MLHCSSEASIDCSTLMAALAVSGPEKRDDPIHNPNSKLRPFFFFLITCVLVPRQIVFGPGPSVLTLLDRQF